MWDGGFRPTNASFSHSFVLGGACERKVEIVIFYGLNLPEIGAIAQDSNESIIVDLSKLFRYNTSRILMMI